MVVGRALCCASRKPGRKWGQIIESQSSTQWPTSSKGRSPPGSWRPNIQTHKPVRDFSHPTMTVLHWFSQCGGCIVTGLLKWHLGFQRVGATGPERQPGCSQLAFNDLAVEVMTGTVVRKVCPGGSREHRFPEPSLVQCQNSHYWKVCVRGNTLTETFWQNIIYYSIFYIILYCFNFNDEHLISERATPI